MEQFTDGSRNLLLRKRILNSKSNEDSPDDDGRCLGFVTKRGLKEQVDREALKWGRLGTHKRPIQHFWAPVARNSRKRIELPKQMTNQPVNFLSISE